MSMIANYNRLIENEHRAKTLRMLIHLAGGVQKFARALGLSSKKVSAMQHGDRVVHEAVLDKALEKFGGGSVVR